MTQVRDFKVDQPLVPGVTLLEASAGTGKTYQIANLVLRLVAEGVADIREIVVVTFTNAATAELKDRIRRRLIAGLHSLSVSADPDENDPLFIHYNQFSDPERLRCQARVQRAMERFDEASISTIHGFCQRLLQNNAFESGADFGMELVKDESPVIERLVDDFLVNTLHSVDTDTYDFLVHQAGYSRAELFALASMATDDLDMPVIPERRANDDHETELERGIQNLKNAWSTLDKNLLRTFERDYAIKASGEASKTLSYVHFSGRSFREDKTLMCLNELEEWITGGCHHPDGGATFFTHFSPERLREGARSEQAKALAQSAIFQRLAEVQRAAKITSNIRIENARLDFIQWIREAYEEAHRKQGTQGYDALVRQLAQQLAHADRRPALVRALRERFKVALIDEFQDTDGDQWDVFRQIFTPRGRDGVDDGYLYLIGDPKQAIYGFRGANIHVYLKAKKAAGKERVFTLTTNYRSDQSYVSALNYLMDQPGFFGDPAIPYIRVDAAHDRGGLRWDNGHPNAALQLRLFDRRCRAEVDAQEAEPMTNEEAQRVLPDLVANDITALLRHGTLPNDEGGNRPVQCGDIAILVYSAYQARDMRAAMDAWGLPAVLASAGSVFQTDEANAVLRWLEAMEHPRREGPARVSAVSPLFGWNGDDLQAVQKGNPDAQNRWERWMDHLHAWSERARLKGFMSAFRHLLEYDRQGETVQEHILGRPNGERVMTNLRHLAEILHTVEASERLGLGALARWLERQLLEPEEQYLDAAQLRLESDSDAVRIVTMHASKGLQYPIVFLPYLWRGRLLDKKTKGFLRVSDPEEPDRRILAVHADIARESLKGPLIERAERSAKEEALRLFYVAMTRAQFSTTLYWGGRVRCGHAASQRPELSPLASVLHGGSPGHPLNDRIKQGVQSVSEDEHETLFSAVMDLAQGHSDNIDASVCSPPNFVEWTKPSQTDNTLTTRMFRREGLDTAWGRWSYSSLTDGQHGHRQDTAEGQDRAGSDDDGQSPDGDADPVRPHSEPPVPLAFFPSGPDAGTCLHEILERIDFQEATASLGNIEYERSLLLVKETLANHGFGEHRFEQETFDGLRAVLNTPVGGPLGDYTLSQLTRADRIDEMAFDFPLSNQSRQHSTHIIQKHHWITAFENFGNQTLSKRYLNSLRQLDFQPIAGFMTGFIDLIFRVPHQDGIRYFVADYKSNRIADWGITPTRSHFAQDAMQMEMENQHYFVQSHLYTVALHRFLTWRLPHYTYETHMGGAYYFFLRGMTGPADFGEKAAHGVHFHRPSRALIEALDDCLGGIQW